jgi:hypothetical protein
LTLLAEYDNCNYVEERGAECGDYPSGGDKWRCLARVPEEMKGEQG